MTHAALKQNQAAEQDTAHLAKSPSRTDIDGWLQKICNSTALTMDLELFCIKL